jgi:hypothetical protein
MLRMAGEGGRVRITVHDEIIKKVLKILWYYPFNNEFFSRGGPGNIPDSAIQNGVDSAILARQVMDSMAISLVALGFPTRFFSSSQLPKIYYTSGLMLYNTI